MPCFRPFVGIALLGLLNAPVWSAPDAPPVASAMPPAVPPSPAQKSLLSQMQDAFSRIAQNVEPTVVNIKTDRLRPADGDDGTDGAPPPARRAAPRPPRRSQATGSGVIVRADGYILTNDHVVAGASGGTVTVTLFDGREFQGRAFSDPKSDLAVVKIDPGSTPLPTATFADSSAVVPGQWAIAVGSPFDLSNTMTIGVISAVNRHQQIPGETLGSGRYYPDLLQTDAAINPGNSGGPLFDIDGHVVGINVAIESPVEGSAGVGFAIPSQVAQRVMDALIRDKKVTRGYLGIAPDDLTPALQEQYGQKRGAFVRDVVLSSPAGRAGLQASDIVTEYGGTPITDEISLRTAISASPPDSKVVIGYVRDGRAKQATVTVGAMPTGSDEISTPIAPTVPRGRLGLSVSNLTASDRARLGLPVGTRGVLVKDVTAGSAAETASLASGQRLQNTVLQKIGQTSIDTKADYERAANALLGKSSTTLVLLSAPANQWHQSALTVRF